MWTSEWWDFIQSSGIPVYLTLGNIPNHLRRKPSQQACILLANFPHGIQRLFHKSMRHVLEPLSDAGKDGIKMTSGDGAVRMVHPVLACYVTDYPEQCMVTCSKYGTSPEGGEARTQGWTLGVMGRARATTDTASKYFAACMEDEVSGYVSRPFWEGLPYTDIYLSITPDVLHQLYQGVLRHLIDWCQTLLTEAELDRRIRRLPRAVGLRHFKNGISALSQISGSERKNMGKILLGCSRGDTNER
ncbi:hypothetical protein BDZ89DRAFT_1097722 [Hymenopellis radicata]|nr:hypothetical protein BDZ89DRAFT_1097722 [Hymenopellis radicata]